jgi:hypothetical protein
MSKQLIFALIFEKILVLSLFIVLYSAKYFLYMTHKVYVKQKLKTWRYKIVY